MDFQEIEVFNMTVLMYNVQQRQTTVIFIYFSFRSQRLEQRFQSGNCSKRGLKLHYRLKIVKNPDFLLIIFEDGR